MSPKNRKIVKIVPFCVFVISFGAYVFTLNPSISAADSTEIVTTSIILGVPHQPSYPLNTLIGHLFSKIPFGTLPWRVNLMSAFFQSLTITLIYFVILKLYKMGPHSVRQPADFAGQPHFAEGFAGQGGLGEIVGIGRYFLAASASLFLAFTLVFWQYGNRVEVFALNNFFLTLLLLIGITLRGRWERWARGEPSFVLQSRTTEGQGGRKTLAKYSYLTKHLPDEALARFSAYKPPIRRSKRPATSAPSLRLLYLFVFVAGLAATHHQTIIFSAAAFLFLFSAAGAYKLWLKKDVLIKLVLVFLLGMLPYFLILTSIAKSNPPIKWGEPATIVGAFKALIRSDYGTFSPYAQNPVEMEGQKPKETWINQEIFYFKSANRDFTTLGLLLAALGAYYLFRYRRQTFIFLILGFMFVGPLFLGYANWTLESGFHQAIVRRFQMLPHIWLTLFLAFGFYFIWFKVEKLGIDLSDKKNLLAVYLLVFGQSLLFIYPASRNFKDADNRDNFLTITYARDSLMEVPNDAIILISGDVTTFSFEYWRNVVAPGDKRIVFSPGLMYLDWYVARLKKNHPEIVVPPTPPGHIEPSTTQIVEANYGRRPIYVSPELARYDPELEQKYVLWPKNLLFLVKQKGEDLRLEPYREENDRFWASHDLKLMEKIRKNNPLLEYAMVPEYARHHANIGGVFESVKLYDDAIREYERALAIHPAFPDPYKNLGRIYGFKLEQKDRPRAWQYFQMFLQTALPSQQEDVYAVQQAMGALQQEAMAEATMSGKLKEASGSAEATSSAQEGN